MASKAKRQEKISAGMGGPVTQLCSINCNGLVFLAANRLEVSSDVTLIVQAGVPGAPQEWEVHGWVVDCRAARGREGLRYEVTILFRDLPAGLKDILVAEHGAGFFPRLRHSAIFGMN